MSETPTEKDQVLKALAIAGSVIAFACTPLLAAADPLKLSIGGGAVGIGLALAWIRDHSESDGAFLAYIDGCSYGLVFIGFGILVYAGMLAVAEKQVDDRRCLAIQRDMLSARPRRSDSPDLFQALGCRPQGEGSVYAPPPAKGARR